jgi:hypothetical protein
MCRHHGILYTGCELLQIVQVDGTWRIKVATLERWIEALAVRTSVSSSVATLTALDAVSVPEVVAILCAFDL